jgi:hypothetical protein
MLLEPCLVLGHVGQPPDGRRDQDEREDAVRIGQGEIELDTPAH